MARLTDDADYDAVETSGNGTRGSVAEWLACQASILHCRGSTPAAGVDKTDARSKLHSTLDENNFWDFKNVFLVRLQIHAIWRANVKFHIEMNGTDYASDQVIFIHFTF
ncbi:unnamed protein product [Protopolystoma xenopodis]|uniref:Uncharacterized protein n=1 Tax=Protopolystoma xenopodis TaxID=117903 RepID=A0A448WC18_9PLAT|nr:unnamed protein product [Protopolystoma xenopodis]